MRRWLAGIAVALLLAAGAVAPALATIGTTISTITAQGNGVTTSFPYPFLMPGTGDAVVSILNTTVSPNTTTQLTATQYTISGIGISSGGSVTYPLTGSPLASGYYLTVSRVLPLIQGTSISNQGPTFAAIESALDYQTMVSQQIKAAISGAAVNIGLNLTNTTLSGATYIPSGSLLGFGTITPQYDIDDQNTVAGQQILRCLNASTSSSTVECKWQFSNGTDLNEVGITGTNASGLGLIFTSHQGFLHTNASNGLAIGSTGGGPISMSSSNSDTTPWFNIPANTHALELGYTSNQTGAVLETNGNAYFNGTTIGTGNASFVSSKISIDSSFATSAGNGTGQISVSSSQGIILGGQGSANDLTLVNTLGNAVLSIGTSASVPSFGSYTGSGCSNSGYITIYDILGNSRKLMVCS